MEILGLESSSINAGFEWRSKRFQEKQIIHPDLKAMVEIPTGEFICQRGKNRIERPFKIDVYPVTNMQFQRSIKTGGYLNMQYWSKDRQKWLKEEEVTEPQLWNAENFNQPDQPVVGVSYFEAEAYAKWTDKRLPSEKEWERAARGID